LNVGQFAGQVAADIQVPTHIIQGIDDEIVKVEHTRELLQRLAGRVSYEELPTGHGLVAHDNSGFRQMYQSVLGYAHRLVMPDGQQQRVV
jgi:surfactin synthase thioesterase subunit